MNLHPHEIALHRALTPVEMLPDEIEVWIGPDDVKISRGGAGVDERRIDETVLAARRRPRCRERQEKSPLAPVDQVGRNGIVKATLIRCLRTKCADSDIDSERGSISDRPDASSKPLHPRAWFRVADIVPIGVGVRGKSLAV